MSLRTWLLRWIAKLPGDVPDDPNELVVLATVPMFEGPILAEVLARSAIPVSQAETFDGVLGSEKMILRVPRADLERANQVMADYKNV